MPLAELKNDLFSVAAAIQTLRVWLLLRHILVSWTQRGNNMNDCDRPKAQTPSTMQCAVVPFFWNVSV